MTKITQTKKQSKLKKSNSISLGEQIFKFSTFEKNAFLTAFVQRNCTFYLKKPILATNSWILKARPIFALKKCPKFTSKKIQPD